MTRKHALREISALNRPQIIENIERNDVLLGRGAFCINHVGNVLFRDLCAGERKLYGSTLNREKKQSIAEGILFTINSVNGRFLRVASQTELEEAGVPHLSKGWVIANRTVVIEKIKQVLREKTYFPKVKEQKVQKESRGGTFDRPHENVQHQRVADCDQHLSEAYSHGIHEVLGRNANQSAISSGVNPFGDPVISGTSSLLSDQNLQQNVFRSDPAHSLSATNSTYQHMFNSDVNNVQIKRNGPDWSLNMDDGSNNVASTSSLLPRALIGTNRDLTNLSLLHENESLLSQQRLSEYNDTISRILHQDTLAQLNSPTLFQQPPQRPFLARLNELLMDNNNTPTSLMHTRTLPDSSILDTNVLTSSGRTNQTSRIQVNTNFATSTQQQDHFNQHNLGRNALRHPQPSNIRQSDLARTSMSKTDAETESFEDNDV
jgi:hypothetical protein